MFKGLRTKIESEGKGQSNTRSGDTGGASVSGSDETTQSCERGPGHGYLSKRDEKPIIGRGEEQLDNKDPSRHEATQKTSIDPGTAPARTTDKISQTMEDLRQEIIALRNQLSTVVRERDESNDQNAQLYQLIEKLKGNLEHEKEINASQQNELKEVNSALQEKTDLITSMKIKPNSISMQPFRSTSPGGLNSAEHKSSESIEALQSKVDELQGKLSEKNRQLRVRQQNLSDVKKALLRELSDHNKTKEELTKLQQQMHSQVASEDVANTNNGSNASDTDINQKSPFQSSSNDRNQDNVQSHASNDRNDEGKDYSVTASQLDAMSCLSMSSASVEDMDSNDLQQNSCNKGVNLEYLKNVLYSYMTSTDTETAQHLVKVLSVMMNFTPEQSAAVKSAMSVKSSWLRLK